MIITVGDYIIHVNQKLITKISSEFPVYNQEDLKLESIHITHAHYIWMAILLGEGWGGVRGGGGGGVQTFKYDFITLL